MDQVTQALMEVQSQKGQLERRVAELEQASGAAACGRARAGPGPEWRGRRGCGRRHALTWRHSLCWGGSAKGLLWHGALATLPPRLLAAVSHAY